MSAASTRTIRWKIGRLVSPVTNVVRVVIDSQDLFRDFVRGYLKVAHQFWMVRAVWFLARVIELSP